MIMQLFHNLQLSLDKAHSELPGIFPLGCFFIAIYPHEETQRWMF